MEELTRLAQLVERQPGVTAIELRDALRRDGRSSMTTADVERTLASAADLFTTAGEAPRRRWWPAGDSGPSVRSAAADVLPAAARPNLYPWQRSALEAWRTAGHRGVVEAVTGSGKTMIGLVATLDEVARRGQVAIIVPTRELLGQWTSLLRPLLPPGIVLGSLGDGSRHGLDDHDVVVAVVNSARVDDLQPRRPGGLLVADECHRYGSACNRLVLRERFPRRLGLSATFARPDDAHQVLLAPYLGDVCFRLGYAQARQDGVIAPFDVLLVTVELDDRERWAYDDASQQMAAARGALVSRGLLAHDTGPGLFGVLAALARGDGDAAGFALAYLGAMQERRQVMDDASAKRRVLAELAPAVGAAERTIVFTQSIGAAEAAAASLSAHGQHAAAVHSGLGPAARAATMRDFRSGAIVALAAPHVLDEGVDVPEADLAIVLGASRSRRQMVQRMGRVLRRKADGRRARFVVVAARDTVEDPQHGAHEAFLGEITTVARRLDTVVHGSGDLASLLRP